MSDTHIQITPPKRRTVLVVDDEQINRELLGTLLEEDYRVLYAANGQEALALAKERAEDISLILMDLIMPVMSGMVVLRLLKESPELARIPVIVMTADHDAEVASLELGAFDFIPKPYPMRSVILARIRRIIELSEDRQIIRSTERDPLTGLFNREYFYNYIASFDQHHKGTAMDAVVVDINRFHIINERYGRAYADQLLRRIGEHLRALAQDAGGMACRREADTFLVYRPHGGDCEAMLEKLSTDINDDGDTANRVRLRMGVYPNVDKSIEIEQRFDRACVAADSIRGNYTQSIAIYDDKLHEAELFAEQLTEEFDQAIRGDQFKVFYQPKYDIRPDAPILASAEALIRWQHPRLGLISPGVFIPLFEENGMIQRLDHYVWNKAAAQVRDWKNRYGISIPVSVNVSRVDMFDPKIAQTFETLLKANSLAPEELIPEITESAYTDNESLIISTVQTLRTMGLRVEMDDFGTGYSSLGMISRLPLDALKLDMTFVRSAFSGSGDTRMIELIIDIAEYLGVPAIAEGVETREQVEALKVMGCDYAQGYYFSKPVPPEEFERFIEEKALLLKGDPEAGVQAQPWLADPTPMMCGGKRLTYARLAQALAQDYYSFYVVNIETDEFVEYSTGDEYQQLHVEQNGVSFFEDCRRSVIRLVHPDDLKTALQAWEKDRLLAELADGRTFNISYRLMFDGASSWIHCKVIRMRGDDDRFIVIGIRNMDGEKKG